MNILVLAPMECEAENFRQALHKGRTRNHYKVVCCGVGKVEAASCTALEVYNPHFNVDLVVDIGYAAGSKAFNQGDLVFPDSTMFHDVMVPEGFLDHMTKKFQLQGSDDVICLTGDSFVDAELANKLTEKYGENIIFDMECAAIAQVCQEPGVPVLQLKIISDIPQRQCLQDFNEFVQNNTDFTNFVRFLETI